MPTSNHDAWAFDEASIARANPKTCDGVGVTFSNTHVPDVRVAKRIVDVVRSSYTACGTSFLSNANADANARPVGDSIVSTIHEPDALVAYRISVLLVPRGRR